MLYFRNFFTEIGDFIVSLHQKSKEYSYAYKICRKKFPRLCR
jgi:hypothetical protein